MRIVMLLAVGGLALLQPMHVEALQSATYYYCFGQGQRNFDGDSVEIYTRVHSTRANSLSEITLAWQENIREDYSWGIRYSIDVALCYTYNSSLEAARRLDSAKRAAARTGQRVVEVTWYGAP